MTKRRHISLLPSVNQTEALSRFFNSTVDQLFQDGKTEPVSGYIGRKPVHFDPTKDFYKPEPTAAREKYQLEPMMVSRQEGTVRSKLFYEDLLSLLAQEGANISNPSRLFSAGYYSWAPPIDIDRIMNFQQYYWSGAETTALELTVPGVEVGARYYANGTKRAFALPAALPSRSEDEEDVTVLLNGQKTTAWTLVDGEVVFTTAPSADALIVIFRYGNVGNGSRTRFRIPAHCNASEGLTTVYVFLNGRETTDFTVDDEEVVLGTAPATSAHVMVTRLKELKSRIEGGTQFNPVGLTKIAVTKLVDGMRVRLVDPLNFSFGYDLKSYGHPWDELYANTFFVQGVDIRIELFPTDDVTLIGEGYEADEQRYTVVARHDSARSYWSKINRWVHKSAFIDPKEATIQNRAKRPIVEFLPGIKQYQFGTYRIQNTSGMISQAPRLNGSEIDFDSINGVPEGALEIDNGFRPRRGDYVLVNLSGQAQNNTVFYVDVAESDDGPLMVLEPFLTVDEGAVTSIKNRDFYFEGNSWKQAPTPQQFPLFELYDSDGVSLHDGGVYPETDFAGSKIFGFAIGSGKVDPLVKLSLRHDTYGQIQFENELATRSFAYRDGVIGGYYYYLRNGAFANEWHLASDELVQQIDENNVSDIPLGLQANPDFETPTVISRNDWFKHFTSILENQDGFEGKPYSTNNWNDTAKDVTKGLVIIQHKAPLLKLMALMANPEFSIRKALQFAEREYVRQKARLFKHVKEISEEQDTSLVSSETLVSLALQRANSFKSSTFPFANSNVGGGQFYIPITPALLGIVALVRPHTEDDEGLTMIIGHDGSKTPAFGDARDGALLAFERLIYNHAMATRPSMPLATLINGKYRQAPYSDSDLNDAMRPAFEDWVRENRLSLDNLSFDEANPMTWNYSQMVDRDGESLPGHWRAIYRHYFDTDRPNTHPWEMLGFAQQPSWWTTHYGPAPFTRDNEDMWGDIEQGMIREGERAGIHPEYARPNLMQVLPVDKQGRIIDPFSATIILNQTPVQFAKEGWQFGDGSPVEALWRNTSNYVFALALAKFRLKPALFVERFWDIENEALIHGTQTVQLPQKRRVRHAELYVSDEVTPDGTKQQTVGIQNWIVDYLTSRGLASSLLGESIRGLAVNLGHKVAGFTTKDRMTISSESFGLVPDEDIQIALYSSPHHQESFYSGMLIENTAFGWRIIGYNADYPFFDIIKGDPSSKKIKITLDGESERSIADWHPSVYYKSGVYVAYENAVFRCVGAHTSSSKFEDSYWKLDPIGTASTKTTVIRHAREGETARIPYGVTFATKQEVADLIFGHERFLKARGFEFAQDDEAVSSWTTAVRNFLRWSEGDWKEGSFVTLSPSARELTFRATSGLTIKLNDSLIDRTGHSFSHNNYTVDRFDDYTVIRAADDDIYGARLLLTEIEHCLIFSNKTIFEDVIFTPLFNIRQDRLKVSARRAGNWAGRYEAEGFVIDGEAIKPNFAKLGDDIREMFDIELADNTVLRDHARHIIGFESREYLDKLLLSETQQFELYQGMIQQKGSAGALSTILRSDRIGESREVEFLEEWAFRTGQYGAYLPNFDIEFAVTKPFRASQRQTLHFTDAVDPAWVDVSDKWLTAPVALDDMLKVRTDENLSTAGFARLDEARYFSRDFVGLGELAKNNPLAEGDYIWLTHLPVWDMVRLCHPTSDRSSLIALKIDDDFTTDDPGLENPRMIFTGPHTLVVGDVIVVSGNSDPLNSGTHQVLRVGVDWIESDTLRQIVYDSDDLLVARPSPLILRPETTRLAANDLASYEFNGPVYIGDDSDWIVKKKIAGLWVEQRRSGKRIDNTKLLHSVVYRNDSVVRETSLNVQPARDVEISVIDPLSGLIAGIADRELTYKIEFDPADYDTWGPEQVGSLWWDTSTARFVDCYTDAVEELDDHSARYQTEINYRAAQWARVVPTSSVDIYEWTRTTIQPDIFSNYTARTEFIPSLNRQQTIYYCWKLNSPTIPRNGDRRLSARACSELILNPAKGGIVWNAVMAPKAIIVSGSDELFGEQEANYLLRVRATDYEGGIHTQWKLHRAKDTALPPPAYLWEKLQESLRGFDKNFRAVPSTELHAAAATGIGEGQSMFGNNLVEARKSFVTMLNYIMARSDLSRNGLHLLDVFEPVVENLVWTTHSKTPAYLANAQYDAVAFSFEEMISLLTANNRVLLDRRLSDVPSFSVWEKTLDGYRIATAFDHDFEDIETRDDAFSTMNVGETCLVRSDSRAGGFWTIWKKTQTGNIAQDYLSGNSPNMELMAAQRYRTADFWYRADWYADGYSADTPPNVSYATIGERTALEGAAPANDLVRINDTSGWYWTKFVNGEWEIVARQNGTIQLVDAFFQSSKRYAVDGVANVEDVVGRDGSIELEVLTDAIFANILSVADKNELWFSMLHFIHSRVDLVDWAFKTSFLNVLNFNERMWQSPVATTDNTDLLLEYIGEVKPYRTKVRDILRTSAPDIEDANYVVTDFDKPVFFDEDQKAFRVLDPDLDGEILSSGIYRHFTQHADKVRKINVSMLFDRVWGENVAGAGAAQRIMAFYQPGSNMRAKSLDDLLRLDFRGTVYDGRTLAEVEADVRVKGGPADTSQLDVVGAKLRDPTATGKPEELAKFGFSDALVMKVTDKWGNGAPQHIVRQYDVSRRTVDTVSLDIGIVADSVAVFRDGVRAPAGAFAFDAASNTVTVDITNGGDRIATVSVHSFGFAAMDRIIDQKLYRGGGTDFELTDAYTGLVEVLVNGDPVSGVETSLNTVTLPTATQSSDSLLMTLYATENPRPIRQVVETLPYNAAKEWSLANLSENKPYHVEMIVERNGLRLAPPRTFYSDEELSIYVGDVDLSTITVYDDTGEIGTVVDVSSLTNADVPDVETAVSFIGSQRYGMWHNRIVFSDADANARNYTVVVNDGDFVITDSGSLEISASLAPSDEVTVTSFTHSGKMEARTYVFHGKGTGIYPIRTKKHGRAWLTVNGRRLVENVDYVILGRSGGAWDIDPFEAYRYDAYQTVQYALRLPGLDDNARVVITTFEGKENNSASQWQMSSKVPSEAWLFEEEDGALYVPRDAWDIISLDPVRRSGKLTSPVAQEGDRLEISLNPLMAPSSVIPSQPLAVPTKRTPGVLWLDEERIEYFGYARSGNDVVLTELRRATRGTSMIQHEVNALVLAGDAILDRLPPCPDDDYDPDCHCGPEDGTPITGDIALSGQATLQPTIFGEATTIPAGGESLTVLDFVASIAAHHGANLQFGGSISFGSNIQGTSS